MSSVPTLPNELTPQVLAAMNNMAMKAHSAKVIAELPEGASVPTCHTAEAQARISRIIQRELEDKDAEIGRLRARAEAAEAVLSEILGLLASSPQGEETLINAARRLCESITTEYSSAEPAQGEIEAYIREQRRIINLWLTDCPECNGTGVCLGPTQVQCKTCLATGKVPNHAWGEEG